MSKSVFAYALGADVGVPGVPLVTGTVIGRADYLRSEPGYLVEWSTQITGQKSDWFEQTKVVNATTPVVGFNDATLMKVVPAKKSASKRKR